MAREVLTRASARAPWLAVCIVLSALLGLPAPAHAGFPGANGKIAFYTDRDGNLEIYSMNADGSAQTDLTNNPAADRDPAWSPDGTKIAFTSNRDGNLEIYTMNADGSNQTDVTNNAADDELAAWSPDGTKIAFTSNRDGNLEIYTMNADGTNQTRLTNNPNADQAPAWSPDGTKITFQTGRDANWEIYTMNADGSSQTDLTNNSANDEDPNWSPDGTKIAFESDRVNSNFTVFTMNGDGSNQGERTFVPTSAFPAWSPDGTKIAYATDRFGNFEILTMNPDGSGPQARLTTNTAFDSAPDWQPVVRNYARPKGATPLRVSLTPAYKLCTVPNSAHKAPLSSPSCVPPQPTSSYLTVGTLNFNGQPANSIGSVRFDVQTGPPEDGTVAVSMTDVRCAGVSGGCSGALADYADDLGFEATFRLTDLGNGYGALPGTVIDLPLRFSVPCTLTAATTIGSTCSLNTTINTLFGSAAVVAGQREIWQLNGDVKLYDGGADGVASTRGDDTLFAQGGLFFP